MLEKDKLIGSCNLGGSMFARGKGEEHWQQVLRFTKQVSKETRSTGGEREEKEEEEKKKEKQLK